jgi:hypothetical protein
LRSRLPILYMLRVHVALPVDANANLTQDLVFIEEAFERLLLDYDRVFSAMGIPACLWRRTGEIYKVGFVSDTYSIFLGLRILYREIKSLRI